jgi:hypothetical protein
MKKPIAIKKPQGRRKFVSANGNGNQVTSIGAVTARGVRPHANVR